MAQETAYFPIDKGVGLHDTTLLEQALASMPGVTSVGIDKENVGISVAFQDASVSPAAIRAKIEVLGYPVAH